MGTDEEPNLITVREARERLGVSRVTMARLLRDKHLTVYPYPLDLRVKLVDEAEVEKLLKLRSMTSEAAGKIAA